MYRPKNHITIHMTMAMTMRMKMKTMMRTDTKTIKTMPKALTMQWTREIGKTGGFFPSAFLLPKNTLETYQG